MKRNRGRQNKNNDQSREQGRNFLDVPRWSMPAAARAEDEQSALPSLPETNADLAGHEAELDAAHLTLAEEENLHAQLAAELAGGDVDKNAEVEWLMQTHLGKRPALKHKNLLEDQTSTPHQNQKDELLTTDEGIDRLVDGEVPGADEELKTSEVNAFLAEEENVNAMLRAEVAGDHVDFNAEVEWLMQTHLGKRPALKHKHLKETPVTKTEVETENTPAVDETNKPAEDITTVVDSSKSTQERQSLVYEILDWSKYILLALVIGLLITGFVVQRNEVVGISMDPTLQHHDRVWVQKLSKIWGGIERGDIVTVHGAALSDGSLKQEDLVKRVIAVSGDHLEIKGGVVYLNGVLLPEAYLGENVQTLMPDLGVLDIVIPEGQYFVMGDNRPSSKDSRYFGSVAAEAILGEVWFRSSPFDRIGFVQ